MIERLFITLLLILAGSAVYIVFKQEHRRRLKRVTETMTGQPTLLYFRSDHCAACPTQARYLEELVQTWSGRLSLQKVDADIEPEKAAQYHVFTLPTTILVDAGGRVREVNYGLTSTQKLAQQLTVLQST